MDILVGVFFAPWVVRDRKIHDVCNDDVREEHTPRVVAATVALDTQAPSSLLRCHSVSIVVLYDDHNPEASAGDESNRRVSPSSITTLLPQRLSAS